MADEATPATAEIAQPAKEEGEEDNTPAAAEIIDQFKG